MENYPETDSPGVSQLCIVYPRGRSASGPSGSYASRVGLGGRRRDLASCLVGCLTLATGCDSSEVSVSGGFAPTAPGGGFGGGGASAGCFAGDSDLDGINDSLEGSGDADGDG